MIRRNSKCNIFYSFLNLNNKTSHKNLFLFSVYSFSHHFSSLRTIKADQNGLAVENKVWTMEPIVKSQSIPSPPPGFSLTTNAVSEQAWDEIKSYLGLDVEKHNLGIELAGGDEGRCRLATNANDVKNEPSRQSIKINDSDTQCLGNVTSNHNHIPWEPTPYPQNRPVAQFGFRYDYERDIVVVPEDENDVTNNEASDQSVHNSPAPRIPKLFHRLLLQPLQEASGGCEAEERSEREAPPKTESFTQCIVNVYCPINAQTDKIKNHRNTHLSTTCSLGSHIPWHVDNPIFGPRIRVYTFGESRPLHMRLKHNKELHSNLLSSDTIKAEMERIENECSYYTAHPPHCSCYVLSGEARHDWEHSVPSGSGWRVSITFRTLNANECS